MNMKEEKVMNMRAEKFMSMSAEVNEHVRREAN